MLFVFSLRIHKGLNRWLSLMLGLFSQWHLLSYWTLLIVIYKCQSMDFQQPNNVNDEIG